MVVDSPFTKCFKLFALRYRDLMTHRVDLMVSTQHFCTAVAQSVLRLCRAIVGSTSRRSGSDRNAKAITEQNASGGYAGGRNKECNLEGVGMSIVPSKPRWALAESRANDLTNGYDQPPIPVLEIAERSGVNVIFANFGENADTVSGFCDFAKARIYVNAEDIEERQGFTMAHELGHWILHREIYRKNPDLYPVLPRFSEPDKSDPLEKEANKFAACLLVPARLLAPVRNAPSAALARIFGVSRSMMDWRLKNTESWQTKMMSRRLVGA